MPSLVAERVRADIEVLSHAGLHLDAFLAEATASLRRAVPWVAACVGLHDPATRILAGALKYGDLQGNNAMDGVFGRIEYGGEDPTSFQDIHHAGRTAVSMHVDTGGEVERSERMAQLMVPYYGYFDEARFLFEEGETFWGSLSIFRGPDDPAFSAEDTGWLASLSPAFARGVRAGLVAQVAAAIDAQAVGPAVILLDGRDRVTQLSPGGRERLTEMLLGEHSGDPFSVVTALAGSARRFARGETAMPPRVRVRTRSGLWLLLHASPLSDASGAAAGDVVITIEEARPPEVVDLVVAAFGLTARERDVTRMVLQGADTREIAAALFLSPYTVQDHLKSVFDKAGVRSRRELIAKVYTDQYEPRIQSQLGADGWFAQP
ncbi:MAG: helix-turn-helix transcriptional regulator [Microbacteriaceae bacterium]|nr:helix-turn-helix transcriptional regulator [Microbacteriaceae bacterium]